jgi:hypothetical protein
MNKLHSSRLLAGGVLLAALVFMLPAAAGAQITPNPPGGWPVGFNNCSYNSTNGSATCYSSNYGGSCLAQLNTNPPPKGLNGVCNACGTSVCCFGSGDNTGILVLYTQPPCESCAQKGMTWATGQAYRICTLSNY